jgi:heavy metal translocating P-type ATPase
MRARAATDRAATSPASAWAPLGASLVGLVGGAALAGAGVRVGADVAWVAVAALGMALCLIAIVRSLRRGRVGVDLVAVLALAGAVAVHQYLAGAVIGVMLATGQALESWAQGRATSELASLLARAPKSARRYEPGGLANVDLELVVPGDLLLVATGEVVPVDGRVESGSATLDESALTGEALPVTRRAGDEVRSGVVNAGAALELRATTRAADSTYAGVVRLVAAAEGSQAPYVRLADRYALSFLGVTLALAGAAAAFAGLGRAVAVLVVATPCPLILAGPIAQVSGLSRAARRGVIVKGGAVLERLAGCTTLLIDKTGTVTLGHPALTEVVTAGPRAAEEVLALAASLDQVSPHVLASAVVRAALEHGCALDAPRDVHEVPGAGIRGRVDDHEVAVGTATWTGVTGMPPWAKTARRRARLDGALTVFVGVDGAPAGVLVFHDPLRPDAARTIRALRSGGVSRIVMVTGDRADVAETIGAVIGVDQVLAERSPQEKLDAVRLEARAAPTMMVGDGINDAPALALASVGVALGARGATAASEAADVVLTVDRLDRLSEAAVLARRTRRIAVQSMVTGMALSLAAMGAAAAGYLPVIAGAILQEVIDVAVILNALRALRAGPRESRLRADDAALTRRFQDEHHAIRADIERVYAAASSLATLGLAEALVEVRRVHRLLVDEVLPHETAEEEILYPALGRFLGGSDPMGTMSRAHVEIAHQIRRLGQLLAEIGEDQPDAADVDELRGLLYGLHAILRLHTAQEDESYLSLGDEDGPALVASSR